MTLDEAIVQTLEVRKRLPESKLLLFARLRLARTNRSPEPSERAAKTALKAVVEAGNVVRLPTGSYELSATTAKKSKRPAKKKTAPPPQGRVFFFAHEIDAFEKAKKALGKRFKVVATSEASTAFRWKGGPTLRLERSTRAEAVRSMRAWQRMWVAREQFESFFCLAFDDVAAVLDEINTLIEAQVLVGRVTKAPRFLAWNKNLLSVDDEVLVYRSS